mgnify:CR=1 FL=1
MSHLLLLFEFVFQIVIHNIWINRSSLAFIYSAALVSPDDGVAKRAESDLHLGQRVAELVELCF